MKHADIYSNARFAGTVKRYHAWPSLLTQTVGEHTWQIFRIYNMIWGDIPPHVTTAIIWHDAGELYAGDSPYTAKKASIPLKLALTGLEIEGIALMGGPLDPDGRLSDSELKRIKICDNIDMLEQGLVELAMGNKLAEPIVTVTYKFLLTAITSPFIMPGIDPVIAYLVKLRKAAKTYGVPSEAFDVEIERNLAAESTVAYINACVNVGKLVDQPEGVK